MTTRKSIRHARLAALAALALVVAACQQSAEQPKVLQSAADVRQPAGWDDALKLPTTPDLDPDPNVLEVNLEAKIADVEFLPGKKTPAWTYNGGVPGPLLRAKVGDRVIVHFKNSLPEPTSIHWHGLRVPNEMDGAPGATQQPIAPGAEFRYEFTLRDAGTFWYHPHVDSSAQVGRGLYGPIVVDDPNDPVDVRDELVLVLSDIGLTDSGDLVAADSGGAFGTLFGREGNVPLVNGKVVPTPKVRAGKQQRWRIIDAARARYFNLRMPDHRFIRVGGDGGLAARSMDVYNIVLTPGERADAIFTPASAPGSETMLSWVPVDRGYGSQFARPWEDLMKIETVADAAVAPVMSGAEPVELRTIEPIDIAGATHRDIALTIGVTSHDVEMGINGVPHSHAKPIEVKLGATEVWNVINDTDFAHPFHVHGYFFQVLDPERVPEWKDTMNVPAHSKLEIAIRFDERPGVWMYHCHILDHADAGMMGHIHVSEDGAPAADEPEMPHAGHPSAD
jgi:FtsP/CotA-like multicopper oxidase with cupredoxin domain